MFSSVICLNPHPQIFVANPLTSVLNITSIKHFPRRPSSMNIRTHGEMFSLFFDDVYDYRAQKANAIKE